MITGEVSSTTYHFSGYQIERLPYPFLKGAANGRCIVAHLDDSPLSRAEIESLLKALNSCAEKNGLLNKPNNWTLGQSPAAAFRTPEMQDGPNPYLTIFTPKWDDMWRTIFIATPREGAERLLELPI